ncbi:MAG: hypothetical protein QM489_01160 [Candidatus Izemoplasma sp.]
MIYYVFQTLELISQKNIYWFTDCPDYQEPIILGSGVGQSLVSINGAVTYSCPVETSIFGTGDAFYMILDCRHLLPEEGHLWIARDGEVEFYPNCKMWKSRYSDDSGYSQYWLTCPEVIEPSVNAPSIGFRNTDI